MKRIAVIANTSWYIYNFRLNLMRRMEDVGHKVIAVAPPDKYTKAIVGAGFEHESVPFSGAGINPFREFGVVLFLIRKLRKIGCELVLSYTPKGNIYSGLASMVLGINTVPNISGLGSAFIARSPLTYIVRSLYRVVLRKSALVFFQNEEDRRLFVEEHLVKDEKAWRIPGSGVDLARFQTSSDDFSTENKAMRFLLAGRLLWDKGVGEFVQAARVLKSKYPKVEFRLLGFLDVQNPSAISRTHIYKWKSEGVITYLGAAEDVRTFYETTDCVVLPSYYREGVPRTLLEAAAMGVPIITTNTIGCRDAVEDGITGFICKPRDSDDLAQKMEKMIFLSPEQRGAMGKAGRAKMEREFDERIVINQYLTAIEQLSNTNQPNKLFTL